MFHFNRRQALLGAGAAVAVGAFEKLRGSSVPGSGILSFARTGAGDQSQAVTVLTPPSADFNAALGTFYPGLTTVPDWPSVAPFSAIIKNEGVINISAVAAVWNVSRPIGVYPVSMFLVHRPGRRFVSTGDMPWLRTGKACLVTPYISLSPKQYSKAKRFSFSPLINRDAVRRFFTVEGGLGASAVFSLDLTIYADGTFAGPNKFNWLHHYVTMRNAEHDEAVYANKLIRSGAGKAGLAAGLRSHYSVESVAGKDVPHDPTIPYRYYVTRCEYARTLVNWLRGSDKASYVNLLARERAHPRVSQASFARIG